MLLALAVMAFGSVTAQGLTPIPADKEVRTGKLQNGMTYYIRHNEKPKGQADFYITHNVGAIQEDDSQQGLAHFLEHMAFNGTKNLPGKTLTEYLEKIGVKFGTNVNANTSWDVTNYLIKDVPTVREGIIDSALLILHDWSHFISLEPKEIDSERGVIMEELRTRDGASWRSTIGLLKAIGKGTKYEHRNLIGYLDDLKTFQHNELEAFYKKWYRPDYQTVVIVGDLDVDKTEQKLISLMSDIEAPAADAAQKEVIVVPDNEQPIVSILTDPEMQGSSVQLFIKRPALPMQVRNSVQAYSIGIIEAFMSVMTNQRLQDLAMSPEAPFLGGGMAAGDALGMIPTLNSAIFMANTQDGQLKTGFKALYEELEKVRRFGFTAGEFERAQQVLMNSAERSYANRNDRTNGSFVEVYLNNYRHNTPMPDAETEWQLDSMLVKNINVQAVNQYAKQILYPQNQVIIVKAPEKEGVVNPTEEELLQIREEVMNAELKPYEDNIVKKPLIAENIVLKGSPVKKESKNELYGTTEWTLKNGVKIVLKPTTFKADEVIFQAYADGGLSILSDAEYQMGENLSAICSMSGVGEFSASELGKQLSGKNASAGIHVGKYSSYLNGHCSPRDLETMMQLVYLNFTQPRFDEGDYNTFMKMMRSQLENVKSNPDYVMQDTFKDFVYDNNPRCQLISTELLDKFDFKALPALHKKLYPNANSFTFMLTGNFDMETVKPLVEKYIGSLPSSKKEISEMVNDHCDIRKGELNKDFRVAMQQPKVSVHYLFSGDMPYSLKNNFTMTMLTEALNSRYLISIREEKGGTYGVGVGGMLSNIPTETYEMHIVFDTNEKMADELMEIIMQEIHDLAENGPVAEDVEKTRKYLLKEWTNSLEKNNSWVNMLQMYYRFGINSLTETEAAIKSITYDDIKAMANKILDDKNQLRVVMRPETK